MPPPWLNFAVMATGYLLVMGCLAVGLRLARREGRDLPARRRPATPTGWPGLVRRVAGTAVGGYLVLMAVVVGYYEGVAGLGGDFLAAVFTENLLLIGMVVPVFLVVSWVVARWRGRP
ncbi:hypothetical protein E4198_19585 [Streptomyces sp. RKND-216]|uniref:DUF6256 family protein n=1 Tax=Streptomyces sp. RKND-216 TaxID=2562581 RepID=UPI00109DCFA3|nr:DUF6256 family protein [Streptomyces sp. RKND-216]THA26582.1 hypothetical protein E4198_19585 [Streptomyces sp. RKND-216]